MPVVCSLTVHYELMTESHSGCGLFEPGEREHPVLFWKDS